MGRKRMANHYWKFKPELREKVEAYMNREVVIEEVDPFEEIYGARGSNIWAKEGEKVVNPDAFTSDFW